MRATFSSPFWELGPEQLRKHEFEIIALLEGIMEATCGLNTLHQFSVMEGGREDGVTHGQCG